MVNLILCGGIGERLWPISRTRYPKQFSRLVDGKSLLQHTALRNRAACDGTLVVTNVEQYFMARDQLEEVGLPVHFVLETVGRNTAPAIALACLGMEPETLVLVTPSDHLIRDVAKYGDALAAGIGLAEAGNIVTFGITPGWPETGYGYIHADGHKVLSFREKPDVETARSYLEDGGYYWNSGIFLFKAGIFLEELSVWRPDVLSACRTALQEVDTGVDYIRVREQAMQDIPRVSVDYAVMEKSSRIAMVSADMEWSDLGSFSSLHDALPADSEGNVVVNVGGEANGFIGIGASNNFVYTESKKVVAIDISDLMIVDTRDALLVGTRSSSQKVKEVVALLKEEGSRLKDYHVTEYRPWGHFTTLERGHHFLMRSVTVKPGNRLGDHLHGQRNEHWIVVTGTAEIDVDNEVRVILENQSTYIPAGVLHRIGNSGLFPLVLLEVQSGDYLGDDDIIRVETEKDKE